MGLLFCLVVVLSACSQDRPIESSGVLKQSHCPAPLPTEVQQNLSCLVTPPVDVTEFSDENMALIKEQLETGIAGEVHGSVKDQQMFVFTWRDPANFFIYVNLPMTAKDPAVLAKLAALNRHDQVVLKGEFMGNKAPIRHINVTDVQVSVPYKGYSQTNVYEDCAMENILAQQSGTALVHAVVAGGAVVVVEMGNRVFPVFNRNPDIAQYLFRNDKINLKYKVRTFPNRPPHLEVNLVEDNAICVLERIVEGTGEPIEMTGFLVMFPKSPQTKFNIFALFPEDSDGVRRQYTLLGDVEVFTAMRLKLQEVWDKHIQSAEYERNKFINRKIVITAKGTKNVSVPNQANPQIFIDSADDVVIDVQ